MKRTASAMHRPVTAIRPFTASKPRRPYSAYTARGTDEEGPKYDVPETNREWWRTYVKVRKLSPCVKTKETKRERELSLHSNVC